MKRKALVIGLGISGKSASKFLLSLGYEVYGVDQKEERVLEALSSGVKRLIEPDLKGFFLVVISPGVPPTHPLIQQAILDGIDVVGEVELAFRYMKQRSVGITGTNGKTTVTLLVEHVLCSAGMKAKAIGNIGLPLTSYVEKVDFDEIAVIELSSYQLETLKSGYLDAAVILNITPDHLDRYSSLQEYAKTKISIERCIKPEGHLYVYEDVAEEYGSFFSFHFTSFGKGLTSHDLINVKAAELLCSSLGVSHEMFLKGLKTFKKPSHRIELIRELSQVSYYDDSKGTNVDAVIKAVSSMTGPTILIAGGVDKGSSYLPWKEAFQGKVKHLFLIGESALKIEEELGLFFNVQIVDSLANAVQSASSVAMPGDCVLLSPGCSSFDMFRDYVHRGEEFQRFVCLLEDKGE